MQPQPTEFWALTTLEAHVAPENWSILEQAYRDATMRGRSAEMLQTYLIQSVSDPTLWRIVALWPSREALDAYRQSVRTRAVSKCSAPPARNRL